MGIGFYKKEGGGKKWGRTRVRPEEDRIEEWLVNRAEPVAIGVMRVRQGTLSQ